MHGNTKQTPEQKERGYQVMTAVNGPSALKIALGLAPDLIILNLMLAEMDGLEVCRQLRRARDTAMTPIIVVSDKGDEIDTVVSLEVGADAFLTKPISHRELLAQIRALLRRAGSSCTADSAPGGLTSHPLPSSTGELVVGLLRIDLNGRSVTCRGKRVEMPKREFELLVYFARHPETALSRDQLLGLATCRERHQNGAGLGLENLQHRVVAGLADRDAAAVQKRGQILPEPLDGDT